MSDWETEAPWPPQAKRGREIARVDHGGHYIAIVMYRFPDGSESPYIEAHETHEGARSVRVIPFSEGVHLMQNVTCGELHRIGGRDERAQTEAAAEAHTRRVRAEALRDAQRICRERADGLSMVEAAALLGAAQAIDLERGGR